MQTEADRPEAPTVMCNHLGAMFVSSELSRSTWLITSLSPGGGEKVSNKSMRGGDVTGLLEKLRQSFSATLRAPAPVQVDRGDAQ